MARNRNKYVVHNTVLNSWLTPFICFTEKYRDQSLLEEGSSTYRTLKYLSEGSTLTNDLIEVPKGAMVVIFDTFVQLPKQVTIFVYEIINNKYELQLEITRKKVRRSHKIRACMSSLVQVFVKHLFKFHR